MPLTCCNRRDAIRGVHGKTYTSEHAAELYCAAGGADDWFFANATNRAVSGGFCIELRDTGRHGFLLPETEIRPTAEENLAAVLVFAESAME
jgi:carboxypeptidase B